SVVTTLRGYLAPAVLGLQIWDAQGLERRMFAAIGRGPSTGQPVAKSALDTALWDLRAKAAGVPLRCLLGGSSDDRRLRLSWTCTAHTAAEMRADIAAGKAAGFTDFNFKAAVDPRTDVEVARVLREETAPDAFRWADCNQGFHLPDAVRVARAFEDLGVGVLEQPLAADQFPPMAELRRHTALPLAVDESTVSDADFFRHAAAGVVDFLVIKVPRTGGITPTLRQIATALAAGLRLLVSGLTDPFLSKLAALQVAAAHGVTHPSALNGSQFLDEGELFPQKPAMEAGGVVTLPDGPGIGVEPDEAALRALALAL
ncbi:MAG: mandelate racemase/muconate lactonizing enzyme family protein, partial [Gluconacetobacter diazotrophicus]|nr:mandelate racemase/muconate lactonizing enzyme family protein [Gluconacetobacter diazotrophicus]